MELPELRSSKEKNAPNEGSEVRAKTITSEQLYRTMERKTLIKRLEELESENRSLGHKTRRLRYRGTFPTSIVMTSVGGISLLLSYFYSSLILTFIGLGLTLWGALIFYLLPSRYVPEEIMNAIPLSMIRSIDSLVSGMGYKGKTIFLHPRHLKGFSQGYVFIPHDYIFTIPKDEHLAKEELFYDDPLGIFMFAPSQSLVELFERKLNINFAGVDLTYVKENLPKLLIEDLKIIDKLSIENSEGMIHVKIVGESCARLCDAVTRETKIGNHLGCPICAAIALIISKISGKPVVINQGSVTNATIETTYMQLDN